MADLLVVDDDFDTADLLAEALSETGHFCRVARNGREGLERVIERMPDIVLLDVEMPIMNGPDMAMALFVRDCGAEKIPVVLTSAASGLARIAASVGTPYYLGKPYSINELLGLVDRALTERISPHPSPSHEVAT
jgi:CheY-like chemotaxis protein